MLPYIWYRFDDSEVLCEFSNQILIFSGHLDIE